MAHCGFLDRYGTFFNCSYVEGPYKHLTWCKQNSTDEDQLLEEEGWVKLTESLPNEYIFWHIDGLSVPQIRWLQNHGYKIKDYDLFSKKEKLGW